MIKKKSKIDSVDSCKALSIVFMLMNEIIKVMFYIWHIYYILLQYKNNTPQQSRTASERFGDHNLERKIGSQGSRLSQYAFLWQINFVKTFGTIITIKFKKQHL